MKPASPPAPAADERWLADRLKPLWEAPAAASRRTPPPFAHLAAPLVAAAWRDLVAGLPAEVVARLEPAARDDLKAHALARLCAALAPTWQEECFRDRPARETIFLLLAAAPVAPPPSVRRYAAHCRALAEPAGWEAWLERHPTARALIATLLGNWQEATRELLSRLAEDGPALARTWGLDPQAPLRRVEPGAGDPHAGGRTVVRLSFATADGERRLAYKPRDVRVDARWSALVAAAFDDAPPQPAVLPIGDSHGYVAWIEPAPPADPPAYFRQAGRLLALAQLTGLSDLHHENIVATAAGPVVIDLETLFTPSETAPHAPELQPLLDSVLHAGLLPVNLIDRGSGAAEDLSGLGHDPTHGPSPAWRHVNTDAMVYEPGGGRAPPGRLPGPPVVAHLEDLCAGFREAWRAWREPHRQARLAAEFGRCRGLVRRRIIRPTRIYATLLSEATAPAALRSPAARAAVFQRLAATRSPGPLVGEEIAALARQDIPRFTTIVGEAGDPGLAAAEARLARGDDDLWLAWQETVTRALCAARRGAEWPPVADPAAAAGVVRDRLLARRTRDGSGRPCWLGQGPQPRGDVLLPEVPGERWIDGEPGLVTFLALWLRQHPEDGPARAVLAETLAALRAAWTDAGAPAVLARSGPGYAGLGGMLRWVDWLEGAGTDPAGDWSAWRDAWLAPLTPADLPEQADPDFLQGLAGLAGPLARQERAAPCARRRALLARLGELLRARQVAAGGWRNGDQPRPLAGLSHGAGGIGLALIETGVALGDDALVDAGAAGFAYEEAVFDAATGNWPDFRPDVPPGPGMSSWCHGAPGIGLTRLRALQAAPGHRDAPRWRDALARALRHTAAQPLGAHDFICCGNLGRAWILRAAGANLGEPAWIAAADRITAATATRPGPPGFSHATGLEPLGFLHGLAGVGVAWLQHGRAAPDPVDVLLL